MAYQGNIVGHWGHHCHFSRLAADAISMVSSIVYVCFDPVRFIVILYLDWCGRVCISVSVGVATFKSAILGPIHIARHKVVIRPEVLPTRWRSFDGRVFSK